MAHSPQKHAIATPDLILASSSPYRRQLLDKLMIPYRCHAPNIDETPLTDESPRQLVLRLALAKARAAAVDYSQALIIGSDQVAVLDGSIVTKPHTHQRAKAQLQQASDKQVIFLTSLCLFNSVDDSYQVQVVPYTVNFLPLTDSQIDNYLQKEKPYHCAGSFKAEGLGITLCSRLSGEDPNALIGLPLIALAGMLRSAAMEPLSR